MCYYGLCTTRDLLTQFTMMSGFVYLCLKVSCSWGFQTVKYTADCTPWCIFNVKILQRASNFFPHLLPFKGVLKTRLMNHVAYNRNCFFSFTQSFTTTLLPSLQCWPWTRNIFFTGYIPTAKTFSAFPL